MDLPLKKYLIACDTGRQRMTPVMTDVVYVSEHEDHVGFGAVEENRERHMIVTTEFKAEYWITGSDLDNDECAEVAAKTHVMRGVYGPVADELSNIALGVRRGVISKSDVAGLLEDMVDEMTSL